MDSLLNWNYWDQEIIHKNRIKSLIIFINIKIWRKYFMVKFLFEKRIY